MYNYYYSGDILIKLILELLINKLQRCYIRIIKYNTYINIHDTGIF